jgi:hypothetical protein
MFVMNKRIKFSVRTLMVLVVTLLSLQAFSQAKTDTAKAAQPVFTAFMGMYSGKAKALSSDVKKLVNTNPTLKVKDAKGVEYKVMAFEVTWKRKEISDDIKSGKPKVVYYMVGADVKAAQLPELLRKQMSTDLQAGEEVALSNIVYFDPKTKVNRKATNEIVLSIL